MAALVVYESMYGSTQAIAEAIAEGMAPAGPVRVIEVGALTAEPGGSAISGDIDLLVVGGQGQAARFGREGRSQAPAGHRRPSGGRPQDVLGARQVRRTGRG